MKSSRAAVRSTTSVASFERAVRSTTSVSSPDRTITGLSKAGSSSRCVLLRRHHGRFDESSSLAIPNSAKAADGFDEVAPAAVSDAWASGSCAPNR